MDMAFIKVLNMSISASWLVLVVIGLRFLLRKSPRWIHVALWALVAVRLLCPFSIESDVSLIPSPQTVPETILYDRTPAIHSGVELIDKTVNQSLAQNRTPSPGASVNPVQIDLFIWENLWCLGMVVMFAWAGISYARLRRKVAPSVDVGGGVHICDYIDTPFILGIVKPRIYLPSSLEPDAASHVLAHERAHMARRDHWWKPLGYLLLTIYWFNPLLWLAYILLCRDIELACDEKVIRNMEAHQKKAYSEALLHCSVNRRHIAACPLAFGEVGVKERVKTVLNYKKPAFWIVLLAVLALIVTAVCFLTDPRNEEERIFRVEKVVYRNTLVSIHIPEPEISLFRLTSDRVWKGQIADEEWKVLGEFSEIDISNLNFDELFFASGLGMEDDLTLSQLREENRETWLLSVSLEEHPNTTAFYLLFWQKNGDVYLADGIAMTNVHPLHESVLDASMHVNWLYRLVDAESSWEDASTNPYVWTSTVKPQDLHKVWAFPYGQATYSNTIEGNRLEELVNLLNAVKEEEIVAKKPVGMDLDATKVYIYRMDGMTVWLRYLDGSVSIGVSTDAEIWKTEGSWVIENEDLTAWVENLANGGTWMLSDEHREEIRLLLRMEHVQFFDPKTYGELLFVGCAYDNGRGLGVACFEQLPEGYRLRKLIRGAEVKKCASGSELYYCDYQDLRIFLVMNDSVTGMEWSGAYDMDYSVDTHPGLMVEYFPESLDAVYRFNYSGSATTMYMDRNNKPQAQAPAYASDALENPDDAYRVCTNLKLSDVTHIWAAKIVDVDEQYTQAHTWDFTSSQFVELLNLLRSLEENDFQPAEYPELDERMVEIFLRNDTGALFGYPYLSLKIHEGAVYYRLSMDSENHSQAWKIDSQSLLNFLEGFYTSDLPAHNKFAPVPKVNGEVSCEFGGMEIFVPKLPSFEYTLSEDGIRFKPEGAEGYVLVQYCEEAFAFNSVGLNVTSGIFGGKSGVKAYRESERSWDFVEVTVGDAAWYVPKPEGDNMPSLNVRLVNEDLASWVEEYDDLIFWTIHMLRIQVNK